LTGDNFTHIGVTQREEIARHVARGDPDPVALV
jgi:hypothetical protein